MTFEIRRIIVLQYRVHVLHGSLKTNKQAKNKQKNLKTKRRKMKDKFTPLILLMGEPDLVNIVEIITSLILPSCHL